MSEYDNDCAIARDSFEFATETDVLEAMATSDHNGVLMTERWAFSFKPEFFGYVGALRGTKVELPICMVKGCDDYTFGGHFCAEHSSISLDSSTPPAASLDVRKIIYAVATDRELPYGWPDGSGTKNLYTSVQGKPFIMDNIIVRNYPQSKSLEISDDYGATTHRICAHYEGCFELGKHPVGVNFYCDTHSQTTTQSQKTSIRQKMKTGLGILIANYKAGATTEEAAWIRLLREIMRSTKGLSCIVDGTKFNFNFVRKNRQRTLYLYYKTDANAINVICIVQGCGQRSGVNGTHKQRCCERHADQEESIVEKYGLPFEFK